MNETPKGMRLHIAIAGRRNAGKSTLVNALAGQPVSITSPQPGTTTDPVEKTMEFAPIGPVVLIDTAGMDDTGKTGSKRIARSREILARADMAILVTDGNQWTDTEAAIAAMLADAQVPYLIARNKMDLHPADEATTPASCFGSVGISAATGAGMDDLRALVAKMAATLADDTQPLLAGLAPSGGLVVLVVPIDTGAPRGRLILPQVQAIRSCLDSHCACLVVNDAGYADICHKLAFSPDLVVCDSQIVEKVAAATPDTVPMTTFSVLMAAFKGRLDDFARGAAALSALKPGDRVMIEEACSHHPQPDDIGRVKIPALLRRMAGGELDIVFHAGKELAHYDEGIKAIVHCGACVITRRQMLARQQNAAAASLPMANYGMAISCAKGVIERVLAPFPDALRSFREAE